ncbi:MAG TPA: ABC transporter substrate-binding protein [Caulobacteraceae bacterium]|jgi:peptide/nickel transport system substrate-binding protein
MRATPPLVALAAAAFAALAVPAAHAETVLKARLTADIMTLQPGVRRDQNTDDVILHMVEGLVAYRENGEVAPLLAKSWTISADGRTYTFPLRSGVLFHNGQPLTAADAVFSLKRYFAPGSGWRCTSEFGKHGIAQVEAVTAPDPMTVQIRLSQPAPLFLKTLARTDCAEAGIYSRASVGPDGKWRSLIATGPFMIGTWKHGQYIELARFSHYAALPGPRDGNTGGKAALVDRVRFLVIPDSSAARAALLSGSLDVIDSLPPTELGGVRGDKRVKLLQAPSADMWVILFQVQDPVLADARLRRAVALTVDTAGLTRAITWGTSKPDNSPIPTISAYFDPAQAKLRQVNLAEARRLAKEAGYHGQPIRLMTNRQLPQMFDAAVLIQAMARQAGINFQIETVDWASEVEHYAAGKYQALSFSFGARLDPSMSFDMLIGDKKDDPRKAWDSPQAEALLQKTLGVDDKAARQALFDQLQQQFLRDTPAIVLFNATRISAVRANVTGFNEWAAQQQRLWGVALK